MYAICFDLDTNVLQAQYGTSHNNAYGEIRKFLEAAGFTHQQGSVYFGGPTINAVSCVLVVQGLSNQYAWFSPSVRDIRMLRIEENNDLRPAIQD